MGRVDGSGRGAGGRGGEKARGRRAESAPPSPGRLRLPRGRDPGDDFDEDPEPLPFATDFGNVSQRVPAALIGIGRPGGWAFHTDEGAKQFAQDGQECAMEIARVLALASARLLRND